MGDEKSVIVPISVVISTVLLIGIFFVLFNKGADVYGSPRPVVHVEVPLNSNFGLGSSVLFWRIFAISTGGGVILIFVLILLIMHFKKKKVDKVRSDKKPLIVREDFRSVDNEGGKVMKINGLILDGEKFLNEGRKDLASTKYEEISKIYGTLKKKDSEIYEKILDFYGKVAGI